MKDLFDNQLAAIAARDLDALMEQYHDEAVLIRFDVVAEGKAAIRELLGAYLAREPRLEELGNVQITDDVILYNGVMTIGGNRLNTYGTFVVRDGKIWRQTAIALPTP